jgi:putative ABC transport system ATP-binding protein
MLCVEHISVQFPGADEHLLRDVSLFARPGEIVSILGRTGSGKSTLLACITGERLPDRGRVQIDGEDITALPPHRRAGTVALVSQRRGAGVPGHMRVREVLWVFSGSARSPLAFMHRTHADEIARGLLEPLLPRLCDRLDSQVNTLSAGEYQVLSLACATAVLSTSKPGGTRVLLLDEHVAHLDSRTAAFVMELTCKAIRERDLAALLVTHDLRLATSVSDRSIVIRDGRVVHDGHVRQVEEAVHLVYGPGPSNTGALSSHARSSAVGSIVVRPHAEDRP